MDRERVRVLVVGGGVGSRVVGAFLRQSGYSVTRVSSPGESAPALVVARNGARMLSALGEAILAEGISASALEVRGPAGEVVGSESDRGMTGILRSHLIAALARITPRIDERVGVVTAITGPIVEHGERAEYDLIVGADGPRSAVRALLFSPAADAPFSMVSFLARREPDSIAGRILGEGATLDHVPVAPGLALVRVVVSTAKALDLAAAQAAIGPAGEPFFSAIEGAAHIERLVSAPAPKWSSGSAILVGSAAYPLHPLLDQGPAMIFEDGRALQLALDRSESIGEAINAFARMRSERVAAMHEASWALGKAGEKRSGFAASFRSVLHRLAPSLWPKTPAIVQSEAGLDELVSHRPDLAPLTLEARQFLSFLVKIGQVDGRFDEAERAFVRGSLREAGHHATEAEIAIIEAEVRAKMTREIVAPFREKPIEIREQVFQAGVLLAAESGRIASDEHKALREAGQALEIPSEIQARWIAEAIAREGR